MKELIDYIKINKLLEEKQYNIIKFKIQRAHSIMLLYKDEKYKNIINYIKRINFKINDIGKLLPEQWKQFRLFIENDLNEQLNIYNIKNKNINNVTIFGEEKRNCVKCLIPITKNQHDLCDKCRHLCILDECNNKRHNMFNTEIEFCVKHAPKFD